MSLLEDVFLQDEADEAQDLERIIEGDEDIPQRSDSDDDSVKGDDEAEEEKTRVDPTKDGKPKRVTKNPRFVLNPARLTGPRGIQVIPEHFKDFKFKGRGYENEDLDVILKKLEHWAYRLYPKFKFVDCLKKIETLGKKRPVMVHLHKIRSDQYLSDDPVVQKDSSDDEQEPAAAEVDEFDVLLQQQIEIARNTPAPDSAKKIGFDTPNDVSTPMSLPKAASSPSISEEQRERIMKNRRLAEERRMAKLRQIKNDTIENSDNIVKNISRTDEHCDYIDISNDRIVNENINIDLTKNQTVSEKINDGNHDKIDLTYHSENNIIQNDVVSEIDLTDKITNDKVTVNDDYDANTMIDLTNNIANQNTIPPGTNIDLTEIPNDDKINLTNLNDIRKRKSDQNAYDSETSSNKKRRLNKAVIDSSDDENDVMMSNHSVNVEVHCINDRKDGDGNNSSSDDKIHDSNDDDRIEAVHKADELALINAKSNDNNELSSYDDVQNEKNYSKIDTEEKTDESPSINDKSYDKNDSKDSLISENGSYNPKIVSEDSPNKTKNDKVSNEEINNDAAKEDIQDLYFDDDM